MKKNLLIAIVFSTLIALVSIAIFQFTHQEGMSIKVKSRDLANNYKKEEFEEREEEEMKEKTGGLEAQKFWNQMIMDPKTKTVPFDRLFVAYDALKRYSRSGVSLRTNATPVWAERGPTNIQGRLKVIVVDKRDPSGNTLIAGSDTGGLWKTTNALSANPAWIHLDDFMGFLQTQGLAQNPANLNEFYCTTGNISWVSPETAGIGVYKSTDGGTTWGLLNATKGGAFAHAGNVVVTSTGVVFVSTHESGIQRSSDGGATWTKVLGSGVGGASTNQAFDLDLASNGRLYVTTKDKNVYRSDNNGDTWTNISGSITKSDGLIRLAVAPSNPNRVYAFVEWLQNYRTDNGGSSWSGIGNVDSNAYGQPNDGCISMEVDPNNADRLFCGGVSYHMTTDAGATFRRFTEYGHPHVDEHVITFHNSNIVYFGTDGGIYRTTNGTASTPTIQFIGSAMNTTQFYNIDLHPTAGTNYYIGGTQDNSSLVCKGGESTTAQDVWGGDGGFCHIDSNEPNIQWGSGQGTDGGFTTDSWATSKGVGYVPSGNGYFITPTDYDDVNNRLYSTTSDVNSYTVVTGIPNSVAVSAKTISQIGGGKTTCVMVSPNNANTVYFGCDNGKVVKVSNAASTSPAGTAIMSGTAGWISSIAVEKGNENHIIATYSSFGVNHIVETTNGGSSWTNLSNNFPDMPVYNGIFAPGSNSKFILATHLGVWITENLNGAATNWIPFNDGLANVIVRMVKARESDGQVVAGTHGRGIFTTNYFGSNTCTTTPIVAKTQINGGAWQNSASATVTEGGSVSFAPEPTTGGSWSWVGPNSFTATSRQISFTSVAQNITGTYTATYTNTCGAKSTKEFTITVTPAGGVVNIALSATPSTSYVSSWETLSAVNDGFTPANSNDKSHGGYGNWNNPNTLEWVQYDWSSSYTISKVEVFWFDDAGGVLTPTTAYIESWNGSAWVNIGNVPLEKDAFNVLNVANVTSGRLRVSMRNASQSTGILEWRVWGVPATSAPSNIAPLATPTTSFVSSWETLAAVNDNFAPANSNDKSHGAYGNWDNPNTIEWVQYDWPTSYNISKAEVYWFDDGGGVLTPTTGYIEYWNGSIWINAGNIPLVKDVFNNLNISNITASRVRVSMKNTAQSTGILEWRVFGVPSTPARLTLNASADEENVNVSIYPNPSTDAVNVELNNGKDIHLAMYNSNLTLVYESVFSGKTSIPKSRIGKEGVYFIKLTTDNRDYIKKLVIR